MNQKRKKKSVNLIQQILEQLRSASPESSKALTGSIAADLDGLFDFAETHQNQIDELLRMKLPRDKRKFEKLLGHLEANIFHSNWHLKSLKLLLPRLWKDQTSQGHAGKARRMR